MTAFKQTAQEILEKAKEHGLGAYIYHIATTGSIYIRFNDDRMGSIRIGDHRNIDKYKYRYNVRFDFNKIKITKEDGKWRHFYPPSEINKLIEELVKRNQIIKTWAGQPKYHYGVPWFKRKQKENN